MRKGQLEAVLKQLNTTWDDFEAKFDKKHGDSGEPEESTDDDTGSGSNNNKRIKSHQ